MGAPLPARLAPRPPPGGAGRRPARRHRHRRDRRPRRPHARRRPDPTPPGPGGEDGEPVPDPFAWDPDGAEEFERRAAAGNSHLLYALSPGGAVASAERVARWRPQVERAAREGRRRRRHARGARVPRERGPRRTRIAPGASRAPSGSRRSSPRRRTDLLGMHVDTRAQRRAHAPDRPRASGAAASDGGAPARAARRASTSASTRRKALAATGRYLEARPRDVRPRGARVRQLPHGHRQPRGRAARLRRRSRPCLRPGLLRLDAAPATPAAYERLAGLGDDSSNYLWKVARAREIMRLYREDPAELRRGSTALQTAKSSAEEVLHPRRLGRRASPTPDAAARGWDDGDIVALPTAARSPGCARPAHGRAGAAARASRRALPRAAPRGARDGALHRRAGARRERRHGAADRHLDRARRGLPAAARAPQPRGDAQLLAAHHGLGVRRRAPLRLARARRWRSRPCSTGCRCWA